MSTSSIGIRQLRERAGISMDAHRSLWAVALLTFGAGDVLSTVLFIHLGLNSEAHPLSAYLIGKTGLWAIPLLKVAAIGVFAVIYRLCPGEWSIGVPIGLTLIGVVVTVWNCVTSLGMLPA